jgi:hypothetical protein
MMSNRKWIGVLVLLLLFVAAGIGIAAGAYHQGFVHGAVENGARVVYEGRFHGGYGFFPGFFFFPVFLILFFVGLRMLVFGGRRRFYGGGWGDKGGWGDHGPMGPGGPGGPRERIEEWHRQAHASEGQTGPPASTAPSSA